MEEIVIRHFDYLAPMYCFYCQKRNLYLRSLENAVASEIENRASTILRILDLGCGDGHRAERIQKLLSSHHHWVGCDVSEKMLQIAALAATHSSLIHCHAIDLPFPENHFDIVLALFNVIGYIFPRKRRMESLKRLYRILRPGGKLLLDVMNVMHIRDGSFRLPVARQLWRLIYSTFSPRLEGGDIRFTVQVDESRLSVDGVVHTFFPPIFLHTLRRCGFQELSYHYIGYGTGIPRCSIFGGHLFVEATK